MFKWQIGAVPCYSCGAIGNNFDEQLQIRFAGVCLTCSHVPEPAKTEEVHFPGGGCIVTATKRITLRPDDWRKGEPDE